MKNITRLAMIGGLVAFGIAQSQAQPSNTNTNVTAFATNLEQQVNIALSGLVGGASNAAGVATVRLANKDIITSLGDALGITFSPRAKLLEINPSDFSSPPAFVVRDVLSRTNVDTDVSSFFGISTVGGPIDKTKSTPRGGTTGTEWRIDDLTFGSSGGDTNGAAATSIFFSVQGLTTQNLSNGAFMSNVNGPGTVNGLGAVLQGRISTAAAKTTRLAVAQ